MIVRIGSDILSRRYKAWRDGRARVTKTRPGQIVHKYSIVCEVLDSFKLVEWDVLRVIISMMMPT